MKRLFRFGIVGLSGTVVNLAVISLLIHAYQVPAVLADAIAIEVSIISNFFCNHYYTFRRSAGKESRHDTMASVMRKLWRFNLVALGGAAISFSVFTLCYKWGGFPYYLADILGIGVAMSWNYILSVKLVWRLVDE